MAKKTAENSCAAANSLISDVKTLIRTYVDEIFKKIFSHKKATEKLSSKITTVYIADSKHRLSLYFEKKC